MFRKERYKYVIKYIKNYIKDTMNIGWKYKIKIAFMKFIFLNSMANLQKKRAERDLAIYEAMIRKGPKRIKLPNHL